MKKLLLTIMICCTANLIFAQGPTLTSTNSIGAIGSTYVSYSCDTTGISQGNAGANQTYNFSNLVVTTTSTSAVCVAPSTTPYSSTYPTATLAEVSTTLGGSPGTENCKVTNSDESIIGLVSGVSPSQDVIIYTDPAKVITFPFSYSSSVTDNFSGTMTANSVVMTRTGNNTTTADGYGNIILPGKTINNVLRVKSVQNYVDTCIAYDFGGKGTSYSYSWYDGVHKLPILSITKMHQVYMGSPSSVNVVSVADFATGIEDYSNAGANLVVYPNPATYVITIENPQQHQQDYMITLKNIQGQQVLIEKTSFNTTHEINISSLNSGIYFLTLQNDKEIYVKKIVVQ